MATTVKGVNVMAETKEKPRLIIELPQKSKVKVKGFKDASVGDDVTVVVKGEVTSISENADSWDPGKRFGLKIAACEIIVPEANKRVSIEDAVKAAKKKV